MNSFFEGECFFIQSGADSLFFARIKVNFEFFRRKYSLKPRKTARKTLVLQFFAKTVPKYLINFNNYLTKKDFNVIICLLCRDAADIFKLVFLQICEHCCLRFYLISNPLILKMLFVLRVIL